MHRHELTTVCTEQAGLYVQLYIHKIKRTVLTLQQLCTVNYDLDNYLHKDFADNNIIIVLKNCAKYNRDTIAFCLNISETNQTSCYRK